jgi:hypothetical protein
MHRAGAGDFDAPLCRDQAYIGDTGMAFTERILSWRQAQKEM